MKKLALCLLSVIALSVSLSACHTVHGFGQDVSHVGNKVENAADRNK